MTLDAKFQFSFKRLFARAEMTVSIIHGPGELLLAPTLLGDIAVLRLGGSETWKIGKDAFLAATSGVSKKLVTQKMSNAFFSGEGFWVYQVAGTGLLWLQSFGAIIKKDVSLSTFSRGPYLQHATLYGEHTQFIDCSNTVCPARGRGNILHRQRPSGRVELRLQDANGRVRTPRESEVWRRLGVSIHGPRDGLLPDAQVTGVQDAT